MPETSAQQVEAQAHRCVRLFGLATTEPSFPVLAQQLQQTCAAGRGAPQNIAAFLIFAALYKCKCNCCHITACLLRLFRVFPERTHVVACVTLLTEAVLAMY